MNEPALPGGTIRGHAPSVVTLAVDAATAPYGRTGYAPRHVLGLVVIAGSHCL